ncbi:MAG: N-acetylmuramoyl-L-alanine amidase [Verrucomicrobia bacterium]|nr:N-acetylmuramoyl-L-alanine amidase [Verrucomicrobiota bacterium]MCH8511312.1 N-acetylmuramoyl-L-alanine amidase [Kiritimatiellia bacterium]
MHVQSILLLLLVLPWMTFTPALGSGGRPPRDPTPPADRSTARIPVRTFARAQGFSRVRESEKQFHLEGQVHSLVVDKGGRRVVLNDVVLWLNQPVTVDNGHWGFATVDVENTLLPVLRPVAGLAGRGGRVVVLDPGHGGRDSGAVAANGITEKAVCLDISLRVRRHLAAAGYTVYLTRHQDQYLTLEERPRRAKAWNADVFVSIHANSGGNTAANGIETFLLALPGQRSTNDTGGTAPSQLVYEGNQFNPANMTLAYALQKSMLDATKAEDRGIRRARFTILREAPAPSALVEVGFLSNPEEAAKLATAAYRERVAHAIARGIDNYFTEVRRAELLASPQSSPRP